jgi:hypothetical protein
VLIGYPSLELIYQQVPIIYLVVVWFQVEAETDKLVFKLLSCVGHELLYHLRGNRVEPDGRFNWFISIPVMGQNMLRVLCRPLLPRLFHFRK